MANAQPAPKPEDSVDDAPKARPRRRWVLQVLGSLVLLALICELVLRFVFGLGHPLLYQADSACGYLPKPNQHIHRFFCTNDINAAGMRSNAIISPKPPGEFRVLMVGDSVLYGMTHVDQSKITTSILARELPDQLHRPVEVLNASAGGWAVENEVGYLRSRGTFDADAVIFVLNGYDLTQPFNDAVPGVELTVPARDPPLAIWEAWDRYLKPRLFHISVVDRGATAPAVADSNATVSQTLRALDEAKQIAVAHGAKFGVVFSPVVGPDYNQLPPSEAALQQLRQWTSKSQLPLLDLSPADAAASGSEVFFDGIHLNPPGQTIMAHSIEQWPLIREFSKHDR